MHQNFCEIQYFAPMNAVKIETTTGSYDFSNMIRRPLIPPWWSALALRYIGLESKYRARLILRRAFNATMTWKSPNCPFFIRRVRGWSILKRKRVISTKLGKGIWFVETAFFDVDVFMATNHVTNWAFTSGMFLQTRKNRVFWKF